LKLLGLIDIKPRTIDFAIYGSGNYGGPAVHLDYLTRGSAGRNVRRGVGYLQQRTRIGDVR
jgi:hypothetical protein